MYNISDKNFIITGRCTGSCCELFTIGDNTIEQLKHKIELGLYDSDKEDAKMIVDMLVPLTYEEVCEALPKLITFKGKLPHKDKVFGQYFTCKHFDKVTRNCTVYETRPAMCHKYPFSNFEHKCEFKDCTCTFIKEEKEIEKTCLI
jgi:Fe-S-cluster containining protein